MPFLVCASPAHSIRTRHTPYSSGNICVRGVYGLCNASAALAVDDYPLLDWPACVPREKRSEYNRIRITVPTGGKPTKSLRFEPANDIARCAVDWRHRRASNGKDDSSFLAATRDLRLTAIDSKLTPQLAQFRVVLRMFATAFEKTLSKSVAWKIFPSGVRLTLQIVELVIVSCVVELAMTLPMALYFHRIRVFALPVNIFVLPLLVGLMPAALLSLASENVRFW